MRHPLRGGIMHRANARIRLAGKSLNTLRRSVFFLYLENHSLGEWFQKRLLPEDVQRKTPFARIRVRSGTCTKKQREAIRDE